MKRKMTAAVSVMLLLTACGNPAEDSVLDLTALNKTMQYSQVNQMLYDPEPCLGQTVQISGEYYKGNHQPIIRVLDEQACCAQGIEFVLAGEHTYPDDYPAIGDEIVIHGTFNTYEDETGAYVQLKDAVLE